METRMSEICKYIKINKNVRMSELEALYPGVSAMTIRRDLSKLESMGEIVRTHGGARCIEDITRIKEDLYTHRAMEHTAEKSIIAQKAIELSHEGHTIYLDTGTTVAALAQLLTDEKLLIVTPAPNIAIECSKKPNVTVFMTGGFLNSDNLALSGEWHSSVISSINIDCAFMAASAYSKESGFSIGVYEECATKKEIIARASKVVLLMDSSKFNKSMPFTFVRPDDIDVLVTDKKLPDELLSEFKKNNVEVL